MAEAGGPGMPRPAWAWVAGGSSSHTTRPRGPEGSHGGRGCEKQQQTVLGVSTRSKNPTH